MSRPLRPATPWRPDWRVLPPSRSSSGQAWVCLRSLLAAVGLTCWRRWQRPARRLASACGHATQPGVDWCARPTLLLPVECVGDMLVALRLWLAVGQPSASTRAARIAAGWAQSWLAAGFSRVNAATGAAMQPAAPAAGAATLGAPQRRTARRALSLGECQRLAQGARELRGLGLPWRDVGQRLGISASAANMLARGTYATLRAASAESRMSA